MKYLGIDYGTKRIGVAVSDETATLAFPLTTLAASDASADDIQALAQKEGVTCVVMGESRDLHGQPNPLLALTDRLKVALEARGLTVIYEPEFLSTMQAARAGESARTRSVNVSKEHIDESAAAIILQSYLDRS